MPEAMKSAQWKGMSYEMKMLSKAIDASAPSKTWKNGWAWHDIQSPRTYLQPCWMLLTSFTWTNSCWAQMHILMPIKHIPPENSISAWARVLKQPQILICTSISELLGIRKHWNNYIHLFLMHMSRCANHMVHHQGSRPSLYINMDPLQHLIASSSSGGSSWIQWSLTWVSISKFCMY